MTDRKDIGQHEVAAFVERSFGREDAVRWLGVLLPEVGPDRAISLKALKWSPTTIRQYAKETDDRRNPDHPYGVLGKEHAELLIAHTERLGGPKVLAGWAGEIRRFLLTDLADPHAQSLVLAAEARIRQATAELGLAVHRNLSIAWMSAATWETFIELGKDEAMFGGAPFDESTLLAFARTIGSPGNLAILREHGFTLGWHVANSLLPVMQAWEGFEACRATNEERRRWLRTIAAVWYWKYPAGYNRDENRGRIILIEDDEIDPVAFKDALINLDGIVAPNVLEGIMKEHIEGAVADGWL